MLKSTLNQAHRTENKFSQKYPLLYICKTGGIAIIIPAYYNLPCVSCANLR